MAMEVWTVLLPTPRPTLGAGRGSHRVEGPRADDGVAGREGPGRAGQQGTPVLGVVLWAGGGAHGGRSWARLSAHQPSSHTASPAPVHPPSPAWRPQALWPVTPPGTLITGSLAMLSGHCLQGSRRLPGDEPPACQGPCIPLPGHPQPQPHSSQAQTRGNPRAPGLLDTHRSPR